MEIWGTVKDRELALIVAGKCTMTSTLTKSQTRELGPREYTKDGQKYRITATVRMDDCCGNGHNSFAITADIDRKSKGNGHWYQSGGGCCHDVVRRALPELAHLIRWHMCSTDGPLHYLENAHFWAGHRGHCDGKPNSPPNAAHLRSTIVFGAVPEWDVRKRPEDMDDEELDSWLRHRLDTLVSAFKADVEAFGFKW